MRNTSFLCGFSVLLAAALLLNVDGRAYATDIQFHGTILIVECSINGNAKPQTVDFGSAVGIKRIDGKRYAQSVPFSVSCKNYAGGSMPALTLTLEGTATSFNDAAVATDVSGLGIELQSNGVAQPLNKPVTIDVGNIPVLTAVPVADPSVNLSAQKFSATLKLTVEVV